MDDILCGKFKVWKSELQSTVHLADTSIPISASQDILRIYDLNQSETARHRAVPFTIIPGHRGGVISAVHIDPACRYMLSAAGNRGWENTIGTEVLLGYEIGVQDPSGVWHK